MQIGVRASSGEEEGVETLLLNPREEEIGSPHTNKN
jgi:hypothetical protein